MSSLSVEPVTVYTGVSGAANIVLAGESPASLEWTIAPPASGFTAFEVVPGPGLVSAEKTLECAPQGPVLKCVVSGLNPFLIENGTVASVQFTAAGAGSNTPASQAIAIELAAVVASSAEGGKLPAEGASGVITILRKEGMAISPASATLAGGGSMQFGTGRASLWSINPPVGSIGEDGLYNAPAVIGSAQAVQVTAVDAEDPQQTATATINLVAAGVSVSPASVSLGASGSRQFAATVSNAPDSSVTWSYSPEVGTLSAAGLYTAPASVTSTQTVTIKATSVHDPSKSDTSTVTLQGAVSVSVTPASVNLSAGGTQQFAASVVGSGNTSVTWSRSPSTGSINSSGKYTAPSSISSQTTVTVKAVSAADPTKFATATITLNPPVQVAITPTTVTLPALGSQQYTASVSGTTNTAVNWSVSPSMGSISSSGKYTAPSSVSSQTQVIVKATCSADPTKTATSTVTLTPPTQVVQVAITPATVTLSASGAQQFSAAVSGSSNTGVTWSIAPSTGWISSSGKYSAPSSISSQTTVTVKAVSVADPTKSAIATVTLTPPSAPGNSPRGLVAAYGFDDGNGSAAIDESGNNNHGSISRANWTNGGKFGKALAFNGYNAMVTVADAASLDLVSGMTLEAWVNPTANSDWRSVVLKESPNDLAYGLYSNDDGTKPGVWVRGGSTTSSTLGSKVPLNQWTHLAATFDGSRLRFYMNGVLKSSVTISHKINTTSEPLRIGGNTVWGEWFKGRIDEVRIYNRPLSQSEIQSDMNRPVKP